MSVANCWTLTEQGGRVTWLDQLGVVYPGHEFSYLRLGLPSDNKRLLISRSAPPYLGRAADGRQEVRGASLMRREKSLRLAAGARHTLVRVNSPASLQLLTAELPVRPVSTELPTGCYGPEIDWPGNRRVSRSAYSDHLFDLSPGQWFILVDATRLAWKILAQEPGQQPVVSAPNEDELAQAKTLSSLG